MRQLTIFLASFYLGACSDTGTGSKDLAGTDTGSDTASDTAIGPAPDPMVTGNLDTRDGAHFGLVSLVRAYSFYSGAATLIYGASNPDATCEAVAVTLGVEGDYDPNDLFLPGHCNLDVQVTQGPPLEGYDLQTDTGAIVRARCAYGDGEWEYISGSQGQGWYWSGDLFTPNAWKGDMAIAVRNGTSRGLDVELDLREWRGTFPNDLEDTDEHLASGRIEGTLSTINCGALSETAWF